MATGPTDWEKQNQGKAATAFDKARSLQQQKSEQQKAPEAEKSGSQQVKETAPGMNGPKPPGNVRNAVDREAHQNKMARDDKAAMKNDRAEQLRQAAMDRQRNNHGKDQSKGEKER